MQPEISRRCLSCGASIRERAMFCPECGKPLARNSQVAAPAEATEQVGSQSASVPVETAREIKSESTSPAIVNQAPESTASAKIEERQASESAPGKLAGTREKLQRASSVARGVIEDEVKRVEKIRHVSSAVIEEATYDPSLRFVLVALALFIVFILLLVLSKVMG